LVRSTRIIHNSEEFLLQDNGIGAESRTITFLVRPGSKAASGTKNQKTIQTNHGEWIAAASWNADSSRMTNRGSKEFTATFKELLSKYLERSLETDKKVKRAKYSYIENDGRPHSSIAASHPHGLAINQYSKKSLAVESLGTIPGLDSEPKIMETDDIEGFLTRAVDDGYAGAILDDEDLVFSCLNKSEEMIFLKLCLNPDSEKVEEYLLRNDGTWDQYELDEDLEFFLDQDRCDRNMTRNLGKIPFIGHEEMNRAWTLKKPEEKNAPFVLSAEEGPYEGIPGGCASVLFQNKENALNFIRERGLFSFEAVCVDKIKPFIESAKKQKRTILLEPFNHRALGGALWLNNDVIILDSFSGFWTMDKDWSFKPV